MSDNDPLGPGGGLAALNYAAMLDELKEKHRDQTRRLLLSLLPVMDHVSALETYCGELVGRGVAEVPHRSVTLLGEQLLGVLRTAGVEPMESLGRPLDLSRHDVVSVRPTDEVEPDTVIEEEQRGYSWNNHLLRRARVVVAAPLSERPPHDRHRH